MRRLRILLPLLLLLSMLLPASAQGRDLRKKVGIGFNNNFSSLTSISVKVGLPTNLETVNIQIQGLAGFALAADQDNRFFAGGRVLLPILAEDNLNV